MWTLQTEIEIGASADIVWEVLTNFPAYPAWNSFVPDISGELEVGKYLNAYFQAPGGPGMRFRPRVLEVSPGRELRWLGQLLMVGLFDGEHRFAIEPLDPNRVRFLHEERLNGLLVPIVEKLFGRQTRNGFEAMNRGLKARTEAIASHHG
ncbi:MAG: SRPBCC domain-containing protein [Chloroflexi bacterium]|nr:SRPBCC domain-containing protein [Chloroflexota bacterium]